MPAANRHRHANAIPLVSFAAWALVAIFACGGGLGYVWYKNQLYTTGTEIKALERELAELQAKNEVALSKIAKLSSTAKLQESYSTGFIKLIPITHDHVDVITNSANAPKSDEIQAVSNERTHQ